MSKLIAKFHFRPRRHLALAIGGVILVLSVAIVTWWSLSQHNVQLNSTLEKVGRHMILPSGETPTLAVVEDSSKLQSSLKKVAQTNDIVLVYSKAGSVIVYRPSIDKIVTVQPILTGTQANASVNVTVAIFNGSGSEDALKAFITSLYEKYPNIRLIVKDSAPRIFPTTIIYSPSANNSLAEQLSEGLGIKKGITPEGMSNSLANVTFIVGEDYGK